MAFLDDVGELPARHQVELAQLELAGGDGADAREQPAPQRVARTVEEPLEALQPDVAEQRLAHAREQQVLEVQDVPDVAGHLPQQLAGDHVGGRGVGRDGDRDVARGLPVAHDDRVDAAGVLRPVRAGRGEHAARGGEVVGAGQLGQQRLGEHAVGDDEVVVVGGVLGTLLARPDGARPGPHRPAPVGTRRGVDHLGRQPQQRRDPGVLDVARQVGLDLRPVGPLGVVPRHREVGEGVGVARALGAQPRVAALGAPDPADVGGAVEDHDLVAGLVEHLGGAEPGDAGPDDGDPHPVPLTPASRGGGARCRTATSPTP